MCLVYRQNKRMLRGINSLAKVINYTGGYISVSARDGSVDDPTNKHRSRSRCDPLRSSVDLIAAFHRPSPRRPLAFEIRARRHVHVF